MDRKQKYFKRRGKRGVIYLNERHQGVALWDCLHTTDERIAEIRRREIHIAVERGDYHKHKTRVSAILADTVEEMLIGRKKKTADTYRMFVRVHLLPWFGEATLAQLADGDLVEYKRAREQAGASQPTINQEIWLFRSAMKRHGVTLATVSEAYVKPHRVISRYLTEAEMLSITDRMAMPYRAVALIAAYSGLRQMDVASLRWSMVDFKAGYLCRQTAKRRKPVRIPLHPKLVEALALLPRGVGDAPLFEFTSRTPIERHWSRARKDAGHPWARFHDLRHFFGCYLATRGVRREVIAELMGITVQTAARYARFDDATIEDAVGVFCKQTVGKESAKC